MNNKLIKVVFPVLGEVHIETCDKKFGEFIQRQFYTYVSSIKVEKSVHCSCRITAKNFYIVQFFKDILKGNIVSYSRHINIRNEKLYLNNIIFHISEKNELVIEAEKNDEKIWVIKELLFMIKNYSEVKRYAAHHIKFYNQILFPIFSLYASLGYYLVHGSLLKKENRCILVSGLDGVGKSSIANELQAGGWSVCADNFVLFNGENAIALKLAMRLEAHQETGQNVLFQMKGMKEVIDILPDNDSILSPQAIYILEIGKQYIVQEIAFKEVYWSNYMNNAPEIAAANAFIAPILLHYMCKNDRKRAAYFNLPTYMMEIPKGELKKGVRSIENYFGFEKEFCN